MSSAISGYGNHPTSPAGSTPCSARCGSAGRFQNPRPEARHFLAQLFSSSAYNLVTRWFESDTIRQIYAVHCVGSNFASLHGPGSAVPFFMNVLGELDGV